MIEMMTIILQVVVLLCLLGIYIALMERSEKAKSLSLRIKSAAVIISAALALTKLGRNVFFIIAILIIGIIVLAKGKNKKDVHMGT